MIPAQRALSQARRGAFLAQVLLAAALGSGCFAAPRTVEVRATFSEQEVTAEAVLGDVRTFAPDALNQLRTFHEAASPPARWFEKRPWLPRPSTYEWRVEAERADLVIRATMSRADFDTCARDACGKGPERACRDFPIQRCGDEYTLDPELLSSDGVRFLPGSRTAWKAHETTTSLKFEVTPQAATVVEDGPSLAAGAALFKQHPSEARAVAALADEYVKAFQGGDWQAAQKLVKSAADCQSTPIICRLRAEVFHREQAGLLNAYLFRFEGWSLTPPPPSVLLLLHNPYFDMLPGKPLSEVASLRMRVLYEVAQREYRQTGFLMDITGELERICTAARGKSKEQKAFCRALVLPAAR